MNTNDNGEAEIGERFEVPNDSKYKNKKWMDDEKTYAALIEHLDGYVGKLTKELDELGMTDNTIIILTSDNGPLPSETLNSNGKHECKLARKISMNGIKSLI